jgi:type IV pilus assembly protein PilN
MLTLKGRSQSNARVSTYMRNLESSGWMTNPELSVIEARGNNKGLPYEFDLTVKLANPNAPVDTDGDGVPDAPAANAQPAAAVPAAAAAPAAPSTTAAPAAPSTGAKPHNPGDAVAAPAIGAAP